jgi:hypothetical protein
MGYVAWWDEYPGPHIPAPLEIGSCGETDARACKRIPGFDEDELEFNRRFMAISDHDFVCTKSWYVDDRAVGKSSSEPLISFLHVGL